MERWGGVRFGWEEGSLPVVAGGKHGVVEMQSFLGAVSRRNPHLIPVFSAEWDVSPPAGSKGPGGDVG